MATITKRTKACLSEADVTKYATKLQDASFTLDTLTETAAAEQTVISAQAAKEVWEANRRNAWILTALTCGGMVPTTGKAVGPVADGLATLFGAFSVSPDDKAYGAVRKTIARYRWAGLLAVAFGSSKSDSAIYTLAVDAKAAREAFMTSVWPEAKPRPARTTPPVAPPVAPVITSPVVIAKTREDADAMGTPSATLALTTLTESLVERQTISPADKFSLITNALAVLQKYAPTYLSETGVAAIAEAAALVA